jgi:hypothetical protein
MLEPSDRGVLFGHPLLGAVGHSARRPAASLPVAIGLEHPIAIGCSMLGVVARLRITQHGGNVSGNPGVTTRRYRTGLDEIGPAPEQPGWVWTGPGGGLGTDS